MSAYREGEIVDITIRARVARIGEPPYVVVRTDGDVQSVELATDDPAVTITRVAPPEWPPRRDDVWIDGDEDAWYAPANGQLRALTGSHTPADADEVLRTYGTLRLVHRKPDGGESGE